jgi:hypothetical protein
VQTPPPFAGRWTTVPKRGGKVRRIYVPDPQEKRFLRSLLPPLRRLWRLAAGRCMRRENVMMSDYLGAIHGFLPGRSPVTMALRHAEAAAVLSVDIEDFFDSVTESKVRDIILWLSSVPFREPLVDVLNHVFRDGIAAQGLPTSPLVSNIAFLRADAALLRLARDSQLVYTRYADDLVISTRDPSVRMADFLPQVQEVVERSGFRLNPKKVRIQTARAGRIVICGVAVDRDGIHPTRTARRRLRALLHQGKTESAAGLAAWCRLTMPRKYALGMLMSHHGPGSTDLCHAATSPCSSNCTGAHQALEELRRSSNALQLARTVTSALTLYRLAQLFLPSSLHDSRPCLGTVLRFTASTAVSPEAIADALRSHQYSLRLFVPGKPSVDRTSAALLRLARAVSEGVPEEAAATLDKLSGTSGGNP